MTSRFPRFNADFGTTQDRARDLGALVQESAHERDYCLSPRNRFARTDDLVLNLQP